MFLIDILFLRSDIFSDSASCVTEAVSASLQTGWPLASEAGSSPTSICWRDEKLEMDREDELFVLLGEGCFSLAAPGDPGDMSVATMFR